MAAIATRTDEIACPTSSGLYRRPARDPFVAREAIQLATAIGDAGNGSMPFSTQWACQSLSWKAYARRVFQASAALANSSASAESGSYETATASLVMSSALPSRIALGSDNDNLSELK